MADEFEAVCGDALVKFFDADRGHVHESLLFFMRPSCSAAKAIADDDFREKWQAAFAAGEPACEGLGQVHLLSHGIWAYKVNAAGERTDLVYQEPVADYANDYRYAEGLVPTEWKKVAMRRDAASKFEEARNQARSYAQGALAGNELTGYRYAIVVTAEHVDVPGDLNQDGVVYRHLNIVVDPKPPSKR